MKPNEGASKLKKILLESICLLMRCGRLVEMRRGGEG